MYTDLYCSFGYVSARFAEVSVFEYLFGHLFSCKTVLECTFNDDYVHNSS